MTYNFSVATNASTKLFEFRKMFVVRFTVMKYHKKLSFWLSGADGWCWMRVPLHHPDGQYAAAAAAATALTELIIHFLQRGGKHAAPRGPCHIKRPEDSN